MLVKKTPKSIMTEVWMIFSNTLKNTTSKANGKIGCNLQIYLHLIGKILIILLKNQEHSPKKQTKQPEIR